jgi:hypothetical protein
VLISFCLGITAVWFALKLKEKGRSGHKRIRPHACTSLQHSGLMTCGVCGQVNKGSIPANSFAPILKMCEQVRWREP